MREEYIKLIVKILNEFDLQTLRNIYAFCKGLRRTNEILGIK